MIIVYNVFLMSLLIISFAFIGIFVKRKIIKIEFIDPILIGFTTIIAFFQLFALLPMFFKTSFNWFAILLPLCYLISICIILFKYDGKDLLLETKAYLLTKSNYIYYIAIVILSIFTFIAGASISDSWLYTPMVLSTINENTIFYVDNQVHWLDSYYLFVSIIIKLAAGRDYFFLILGIGFLENVMVIMSFKSIIHRYFKENERFVLFVLLIGIFGLTFVLPHYGLKNMMFFHMFKVTASGTLFLYAITNVLLFEYIISRRKNLKYLLILTLSAIAFSSSALFVVPVCMIVYYVDHALTHDVDSQVVEGVFVSMITIIMATLLILLGYNLEVQLKFIVIMIDISIGLLLLYYRKKVALSIFKRISKVNKVLLMIPFLIIVLYFFTGTNVFHQISKLFSYSNSMLFGSKANFYPNIIYNPFLFVILALGVYSLYKNSNGRILKINVLFIIIFANPISYYVLTNIIDPSIYHRIYALVSLNLVMIESLLYIKHKIPHSKNIYYLIVISVVGISMGYSNHQYENLEFYTFNNSFFETKVGGTELFQLPNDLFKEGDIVYGDVSRYGNNITKYFQFNYEATYTNSIEGADYIMCYKDSALCEKYDYLDLYYETANYNIYTYYADEKYLQLDNW